MIHAINTDPYLTGRVIQLSPTERFLSPNLVVKGIEQYKKHLVDSDDTVLSIANQHFNGDTRLWFQIAELNNLSDPLNLPVGEFLKIPDYGN